MEELQLRRNLAIKELNTYKESLDLIHKLNKKEFYAPIRDSVIVRFKYSIDAFFKFLNIYMSVILGLVIQYEDAQSILREAFRQNLVTKEEFEKLVKGIADRSTMLRAYNEEIAESLLKNLSVYYDVMRSVIDRLIV